MTTALTACDDADSALPAVRQLCSRELNWASTLARTYIEPNRTDEFTTLPTTDLLLVLVTGGVYTIESRSGRRWRSTVYRPGSVGLTAPGNASTLRWRSLGTDTLSSLHLYLDPNLFADGGAGSLDALPDVLSADDPTLATMGRALLWALETKASALYADSAAQFLAVHLAQRHPAYREAPDRRGLSERALTDVVAYMHAHLADDVSLDSLSGIAALSKHHFLRSFTASTGTSPHRFLVELRMQRAATLLRTTSAPVSWVATQCGYRSNSHFAAAFRAHLGTSPARYRDVTAP